MASLIASHRPVRGRRRTRRAWTIRRLVAMTGGGCASAIALKRRARLDDVIVTKTRVASRGDRERMTGSRTRPQPRMDAKAVGKAGGPGARRHRRQIRRRGCHARPGGNREPLAWCGLSGRYRLTIACSLGCGALRSCIARALLMVGRRESLSRIGPATARRPRRRSRGARRATNV